MWASSASRLCECWLPDERPAPNWVRTVSAISAAPPVMNGSLAAWLSSWSRQTPTKSRYISSTTGRIPAMAAPTPRPMIAVSEIGVSRTRSPNRSCRPAHQPEDVAAGADVDAGDEHALVAGRARPRGRRGSRPWCGRPARRRPGRGGSVACGPRPDDEVGAASSALGAGEAAGLLHGRRRAPGPPTTPGRRSRRRRSPADRSTRARARAAGRAPATRAAPRATGSARGSPS